MTEEKEHYCFGRFNFITWQQLCITSNASLQCKHTIGMLGKKELHGMDRLKNYYSIQPRHNA